MAQAVVTRPAEEARPMVLTAERQEPVEPQLAELF